MVFQVIGQRPDPPSRVDDRIPESLEAICLKCLEKEPERRYASASALADALDRWLSPGESKCPERPRPAWPRYKVSAGLGSVAMLMILAAGLGLHRHRDSEESPATPSLFDRHIELTIPATGSYPLGTHYIERGRAVVSPQIDPPRVAPTVVRFDLNGDQHKDYLEPSLTRNAQMWEEKRYGIRYWGPREDHQPFEVVYKIHFNFPVRAAAFYASLTLVDADAMGVLEVSADPQQGWVEVVRGGTIFPGGAPVDISQEVRDATTIYVRARLKGRDDGHGSAMAQFLRTSTLPDGHLTTKSPFVFELLAYDQDVPILTGKVRFNDGEVCPLWIDAAGISWLDRVLDKPGEYLGTIEVRADPLKPVSKILRISTMPVRPRREEPQPGRS